jgi:hypothetical protein
MAGTAFTSEIKRCTSSTSDVFMTTNYGGKEIVRQNEVSNSGHFHRFSSNSLFIRLSQRV